MFVVWFCYDSYIVVSPVCWFTWFVFAGDLCGFILVCCLHLLPVVLPSVVWCFGYVVDCGDLHCMVMFAFLGSCGLGWVLACVLRDWCLVVVRCGLGRSAAVVVIAATACRLVVCVWLGVDCLFLYLCIRLADCLVLVGC